MSCKMLYKLKGTSAIDEKRKVSHGGQQLTPSSTSSFPDATVVSLTVSDFTLTGILSLPSGCQHLNPSPVHSFHQLRDKSPSHFLQFLLPQFPLL